MEDTDLIACVYLHEDIERAGIEAIEANSRYVPPRLRSSKKQCSRRRRGSTEPPEAPNALVFDYLPRLEIRFSDIPRTDRGVVFGSSPNCDVVLPFRSVSNCHFSLTHDEMNRPIIKDWGSLMGIEVIYDNEGQGKRRDFRWIVGGHDIPSDKKVILLKLSETITFRLVIAPHDIASQIYIENVGRFRQGTATAEELFGDLNFPARDTELPTGAHTPGSGAIYLRKKLGEGSFGAVTYHWNVSDGSEFALKEPTEAAIKHRKVNHDAWKMEARIMGQISHPHIVRLLESPPTAYLQLRLEYMRYGSLKDWDNISIDETRSILDQCLSGLVYLHEQKPPIVHRDIKPDNILVQHRSPVYVKFGDFGLARDSSELMTICGTPYYQAPEIYLEWQRRRSGEERSSYTTAVDVWSLGVVVYELICDLPPYRTGYKDGGAAWCESIVKKFQNDLRKRPEELGQFPLSAMMVTSPDSRGTARECRELSSTTAAGSQTPRPAPDAEEGENTTARYSSEGGQAELAYFLEDYSQDPLDPLYVGSSLASWAGLEAADQGSDYSHGSALQNENPSGAGDAGGHIRRGSALASAQDETCFLENEGDNTGSAADLLAVDETSRVAILLEAMRRDSRQ